MLVLTFVSGCNGQSKASDNWLKVCPAEQFCFSYPATMQANSQQMIDSIAGSYSNESLQLSYDFGMYSSNHSELPSSDIQEVSIEGRQGNVVVSGNIMALHIPVVRQQVKLSLELRFTGEIDRALGQKIFESITFVPQQ